VNELGLEDSTDTLGRWMAHHVAELMVKAEEESDPVSRQTAQNRAVETILKIWNNRKTLPGNADPLKRYERIVDMLVQLEEPPRIWRGRNRTSANETCLKLFLDLRRLVDAMLTLDGHTPHFLRSTAAEAVAPFQSESEQELMRLFRELTGNSGSAELESPLEVLEAEFTSAPDHRSKVDALVHILRIHLDALEASLLEQQIETNKDSVQS
jgi:hypothetical protein